MIDLSRREFLQISACALFLKLPAPPAPAGAQKGHVAREFPEHTVSILCTAWSPDGKRVAAGGLNEAIWVWDPRSGRLDTILKPGCADIMRLSFSPDGKWLAVGGQRATRLYELPSGKLYDDGLDGFVGSVPLMAFSPDGKRIAGADEDGTLRFFDNMGLHAITASEQGGSGGLAWSPDSRHVVIGDINKLRMFDADTGKKIWRWNDTPSSVHSLAWSKDGKTIAFGCGDNAIYLVNASTGKQQGKLEGHTEVSHSLAFADDDRLLFSAASDNTVGVWDMQTGKNRTFMTVGKDDTTSVSFSPDAKQCIVGGYLDHTAIYDMP